MLFPTYPPTAGTVHASGSAVPTCGCRPSRRGFLSALGGLAAAAALPGCAGTGMSPTGPSGLVGNRCIDVHHHFWSPTYLKAIADAGIAEAPAKRWTPAASLADMDAAGVATSILSVTTPGTTFTDVANGRRLSRDSNEYAAGLIAAHPGRFGLFAMIPLGDTEGSLAEIGYALDVLKADGIGLLTSYNGKYLGDRSFWPVLEELNRRKALVYTHPTAGPCCRQMIEEVPTSIIEFETDTSRTIASLVFTGTSARYPDIRWIFSHAGGTMPFLVERYERLPRIAPGLQKNLPNGVLAELKKFNYDVAQAAHPPALAALTRLIPTSQIVFGTDYPYRTSIDHVKGLADFGFDAADLYAIERGNALRLLGRAAG